MLWGKETQRFQISWNVSTSPQEKTAKGNQTNPACNTSIQLLVVAQLPSCYMTALKNFQASITILLCQDAVGLKP